MKHVKKEYSSESKPKIINFQMKIRYSALRPPNAESLPTEVRQVVEESSDKKNSPAEILAKCDALIPCYPKLAILRNIRYSQLAMLGREDEALVEAELCFHKNKNYVFGRLGYAQVLFHLERYDEMEEVMEHFTKPLTVFYPKRTEFQYKEAALFLFLQAAFFYRRNDIKSTEMILSSLKDMTLDEDIETFQYFISCIVAMKTKLAEQSSLPSQSDATDE